MYFPGMVFFVTLTSDIGAKQPYIFFVTFVTGFFLQNLHFITACDNVCIHTKTK